MVRLVDRVYAHIQDGKIANMRIRETYEGPAREALDRGLLFASQIIDRRTVYTFDEETSAFVDQLARTPIDNWWTRNRAELQQQDSIMVEVTFNGYNQRPIRMVICVANNALTLFREHPEQRRYIDQYPFGLAWDPDTLKLADESTAKRWISVMRAVGSGYFYVEEELTKKAIEDESWDSILANVDATDTVFPIGASNNPDFLSYDALTPDYQTTLEYAVEGDLNPIRFAMAAYAVTRFDRESVESRPRSVGRSLVSSKSQVPARTVHEIVLDLVPRSRKLLVKAQKHATEQRERVKTRKKRHKVAPHDRHYKSGLVIRIEEHERGDQELGWATPRYRVRLRAD